MRELQALRARLDGDVIAPNDPGWDRARQAWNLVVDQRPAFVVAAASVADVVAAVGFARANGLTVAPQSTGHGAVSLADLAGTILLRTAALNAVSVDPVARTARVGAGAQWRDVVPVAAEHGLAALHGFAPTVGVAGYVLGGGLGWLSRAHGLASNHVRALEVVTADGTQRRVDAASDPDLFWALRGGSGTHAIVTALELELFAQAEVVAGTLMWPLERAPAVAHAWRAWSTTLPDTLTSSLRLVRFPPLPTLPELLRGRALVSVTLAFTGPAAEADALIAPLRALGPPFLDTIAAMPAAGLAAIAGDPEEPVPARSDGVLLRDLDAAGIDAFLELAGPGAELPLLSLELRHLGGALDRGSPDHGALDVIAAPYVLFGAGMAMSPELDAAASAALERVLARMAPWSADRTTLTFAELQPGLRRSFPAAVADRLAALKAVYDPDGLIVANHAVD